MTTGGFSQQGLERVSRVLSGHVEEGHVPGLVSLIARRGDVQVNALGIKTAAGREPIEPDSIFRIASMTKPIVEVAFVGLQYGRQRRAHVDWQDLPAAQGLHFHQWSLASPLHHPRHICRDHW